MGYNGKSSPSPDNIIEYLLKRRIITDNGCWNFTGATNKQGYGSVVIKLAKFNLKSMNVHRVYYLLFKKLTLDNKLHVLHTCRTKNCFNPDHLYLGTSMSNRHDAMRDGTAYLNKDKRNKLGQFI